MNQRVSGYIGLLLLSGSLCAQPILVTPQQKDAFAGSSLSNLRLLKQSPDGAEAILIVDFRYDGLYGPTARLLTLISDNKQPKVSDWFGANPVTISSGHGTISLKVRFFNDEPGVPPQLTTDHVRVLMMTDGGTSVISQGIFSKLIKWGGPNAAVPSAPAQAAPPTGEASLKTAQEQHLADERAKADAEAKQREEARLKREADEKARQDAEAKRLADEKAKADAEAKAREDARLKEQADVEASLDAAAKRYAGNEARQQAEAKRLADQKAKPDADAKTGQGAAAKQPPQKSGAEADAKAREEALSKAKADEKARQDAEAKRMADEKAKADAEAKTREEAEARVKAEADEKARQEVETQRLAGEKAKAEADATARQQAETQRLAEEKSKAEAEAKAAAQAAPSPKPAFVLSSKAKTKVTNIDVVNRNIDRTEMLIAVEYQYAKEDGPVRMGIDLESTADPGASACFSSAPGDIGKGSRNFVMFPVKFNQSAAQTANLSTDKVWVYLADASGRKSYIFQGTMMLRWRVAGSTASEAPSPAEAGGASTLEIESFKQNDLFSGYVAVQYNLRSGRGRLRLRVFDSANPSTAGWFASDDVAIKSGPGMELVKIAVPKSAASPDVFNADTVEVQILTSKDAVLATARKQSPMSWAKPK
jgi:hypothetical protein